MALTSPGVEVSIIDESQYLPGATASIPFFLVATAQDKADPTSTATAAATTSANAGKLYRITSQRDLVSLYGNPFFYTASNGTPLQGYELNEYGLLAAYSSLGISNQVFVLRADVDLASLVGSTGRPTGAPTDGSFWLNTTSSTWGINEFNETTGAFKPCTPIVISDSTLLSIGTPLQSVGSIGDYAVVSIPNYRNPNNDNAPTYWYKNSQNTWVSLDSDEWFKAWPSITAPTSNPTLTQGDTINLVVNSTNLVTLTVSAAPNNTITQLAADINALGWAYISAAVVNNKLEIYSAQTGGDQGSPEFPFFIRLNGATGTIFTDLGFTGSTVTGFQPRAYYGTSAQQPLWQTGQAQPAPTGSVWIKVDGTGLQPVISEYDSTSASYTAKTPTFATSDWSQIYSADTTGGQAIAAGSVYAQYGFNGEYLGSPVYYFYRVATGATVINGTNTTPDFTAGPYVARVQISTPGSQTLSSPYTFNLGDNTDASDFVTAWSAANIPYTSASVNDDGSIQLQHTSGGVIILDDFNNTTGVSQALFSQAGFTTATTGCKIGPFRDDITFQPTQSATTGSGASLQISVTNDYGYYDFDPDAVVVGGTGHAVGDVVTFLGTDLGGASPANDLKVEITSVTTGVVTSYTLTSGTGADAFTTQLSNWREFSLTTTGADSLTANEGAPTAIPSNFTNWFYSSSRHYD